MLAPVNCLGRVDPVLQGVPIAFRRTRAGGSAMHSTPRPAARRRRQAGRASAGLGAAARGLHHGHKIALVRPAHWRAFLRAGFSKSTIGGSGSGPSLAGGEGAGAAQPTPAATFPTMARPPLSTFTRPTVILGCPLPRCLASASTCRMYMPISRSAWDR